MLRLISSAGRHGQDWVYQTGSQRQRATLWCWGSGPRYKVSVMSLMCWSDQSWLISIKHQPPEAKGIQQIRHRKLKLSWWKKDRTSILKQRMNSTCGPGQQDHTGYWTLNWPWWSRSGAGRWFASHNVNLICSGHSSQVSCFSVTGFRYFSA